MKSINLKLSENSYKIVIGNNILSKIGRTLKPLNVGRDAIIITNSNIRKFHGKALLRGLKSERMSAKFFEIPEGERSKSIKVAIDLIDRISKYAVNKDPFVIAFGGGVVGDVAGFVAAIYKRGIPCVQVPTTFLAQIDSAIGGKVGVDLPSGKNLLGAFYQPKVVFSDVSVLSTLSKRQVRNGLAEAIKYGIIKDKKLFEFISKNSARLLDCDREALMRVVVASSKIKAQVVMADEKETKGIRTILNFGHTAGHAIEAAAKYNYYHHGEAIALGMRVASDISRRVGYLSQKNVDRINDVITAVGLPKKIQKVRLSDILRTMQYDKKFKAGRNRFVLASQIGNVRVVEAISMNIIKKAIQSLTG